MTGVEPPELPKETAKSPPSTSPSRPGTILGIEIGYNALYMVRLRRAVEGSLFVERCRTFGFDPSIKLSSSAFSAVIKAALKGFRGTEKDLEIWAAPKLDRARLHHVKIPQVSQNRLEGAVYWGLQREEPFLEKETVVDFQIEDKAAGNSSLNVTGALIERDGIEEIQQAFVQAGYPLTGIGLPVFALRNLVNLRGEVNHDAPVLICHLGQLATTVSFLLNGRLVFTRNIPLGLQNLAETVVKELDPPPSHQEASAMVLRLGQGVGEVPLEERHQYDTVFSLLRPILGRAARQIERTIEYYQSNFDTEPIERIYLGGDTAARGRVFDYISEQLTPEVVAIDPFETPGLRTKTSLPEEKGERIAYGPAFGLALEGSRGGINLGHTYKERQVEKKYRKITTAVSVFLMLVTVAAAVFFNWQELQLKGLKTERDDVKRSIKALGPKLTEESITQATEEVKALQERRRAASKRYEGQALLSEVTMLTPENISLLHISAAMGGAITLLDIPAIKEKPVNVTAKEKGSMVLRGVVTGERTSLETSLTIYVARLDQSYLFRSVEVEATKLVENSDQLYLTFTLKLLTMTNLEEEFVK